MAVIRIIRMIFYAAYFIIAILTGLTIYDHEKTDLTKKIKAKAEEYGKQYNIDATYVVVWGAIASIIILQIINSILVRILM